MSVFDILIPVFYTLCIYTYVYKESPYWRFAEQTFIGLALGYGTIMALQNIVTVAWIPISTGANYLFIVSIILGLMLYTRFSVRYSWISRWPMAVLIGLGTGISMRTVVEAQIVKQISATLIPLLTEGALGTFNNICIVIMVCTSLFFFTFTRAKGENAQKIRRLGRYTLMMTFGAAFGGTVMTRMTLFIGRFTFLLSEDILNYTIAIGAVMIITLALKERIEKTFQNLVTQ